MKYAITQIGWRAVNDDIKPEELAEGETLVDALPQWLLDKVAEYETRSGATETLNALSRQANAQVIAIQGRVTTLDFAVNGQDLEDPEYMPPLDSEIAELPVRVAQLKAWNLYSTRLGRVKLQPTWPSAPSWPAIPEPYTNEVSVMSQPVA
ncbi:hypothetical protein [Pseudomonas syringae]|uniref:hypothetical protein n=1 Tax=Pseudomonas syringae TaxID=317 RepID=UPI000467A495|nr:hypothetical protein [Pseudomonas syringae]